jgi:exodeoxyribonuclease VIII
MSYQDYFKIPGVSSHALIDMQRSPFHCWASYLDPNRVESESSKAMRIGTLVHILVFEPDQFNNEFIISKLGRRTKAGKAEYAALKESGKIVITDKEFEIGMQVAKSVRRSPPASSLLVTGEPEKTLIVEREPNLLQLKGRLDWFNPVAPSIVELKTAADASYDAFMRSVYSYGYHLSASYYQMLAGKMLDILPEYIGHAFIVVETKPPYAVAVYRSSPILLSEGRALWVSALRRFDECWLAKNWPSYEPCELGSNLVKQYQTGNVDL